MEMCVQALERSNIDLRQKLILTDSNIKPNYTLFTSTSVFKPKSAPLLYGPLVHHLFTALRSMVCRCPSSQELGQTAATSQTFLTC